MGDFGVLYTVVAISRTAAPPIVKETSATDIIEIDSKGGQNLICVIVYRPK